MKKSSQLLAALAIILCQSTLLLADGSEPANNDSTQDSSNQTHFDRNAIPEITPAASPAVSRWADPYLTADFIYWYSRMEHLAFALTGAGNLPAVPGEAQSVSKGHAYAPDWQVSPGFKVGLGLDLDHDGWDIYGQYTWFRTNPAKRTVNAPSSGSNLVSPYFTIAGQTFLAHETGEEAAANQTLSQAKSIWHLQMNVLDLELGRSFYISKSLVLRPAFGLKGFWNNDNYALHFTRIVTDDPVYNFNAHTNTWGFGLRGAFEGAWHFTKNFSLIGDLALSGVWESFSTDYTEGVVKNDIETQNVNFNEHYHSLRTIFEWMGGFRWETWFSNDNYHFALQAGWEAQVWTNQNQTGATEGELIVQGLTTQVRFDF